MNDLMWRDRIGSTFRDIDAAINAEAQGRTVSAHDHLCEREWSGCGCGHRAQDQDDPEAFLAELAEGRL